MEFKGLVSTFDCLNEFNEPLTMRSLGSNDTVNILEYISSVVGALGVFFLREFEWNWKWMRIPNCFWMHLERESNLQRDTCFTHSAIFDWTPQAVAGQVGKGGGKEGERGASGSGLWWRMICTKRKSRIAADWLIIFCDWFH